MIYLLLPDCSFGEIKCTRLQRVVRTIPSYNKQMSLHQNYCGPFLNDLEALASRTRPHRKALVHNDEITK